MLISLVHNVCKDLLAYLIERKLSEVKVKSGKMTSCCAGKEKDFIFGCSSSRKGEEG